MNEMAHVWSASIQLIGMVITIVIVIVKVRASTQAAISSVCAETITIKESVVLLQTEIKVLGSVIGDLRVVIAERGAQKAAIERRLGVLEKEVTRLRDT